MTWVTLNMSSPLSFAAAYLFSEVGQCPRPVRFKILLSYLKNLIMLTWFISLQVEATEIVYYLFYTAKTMHRTTEFKYMEMEWCIFSECVEFMQLVSSKKKKKKERFWLANIDCWLIFNWNVWLPAKQK